MQDTAERVQDLARFRVPEGFRGRSALAVQLWWAVQATLFRLSPQVCYGWRRWLLRLFGARVGSRVLVRPSVRITYPWNVTLGDRAWIGDDVVLYSLGPIDIGHDAVVSQRCYLCAGTHDHEQPDFPILGRPIAVGPEAWLAADVFVAPGVSIGRGAVVGARSSVFADLPEMMVCFGTPARPVRPRLGPRAAVRPRIVAQSAASGRSR
ncbi:MAG: colanic acid biosynthesis acetyltransferase WcaF [Rhodospirillaceae bacterium]|nr:colanic acid biosynthesis acetyltransferase WcaF [Rhodospirillaceae bacterium]